MCPSRKEFARESSWMATFRDPNIARVMGVCSQEEPFCLLQEYCEFGDLPTFLQLQSTSPDEENPALRWAPSIVNILRLNILYTEDEQYYRRVHPATVSSESSLGSERSYVPNLSRTNRTFHVLRDLTLRSANSINTLLGKPFRSIEYSLSLPLSVCSKDKQPRRPRDGEGANTSTRERPFAKLLITKWTLLLFK